MRRKSRVPDSGKFRRSNIEITTHNSGVLWTPDNIDTELWLDASDTNSITLNGTTVSQWNDKSGNNRHLAQGDAAYQPTIQNSSVNNLNVIRFDGSGDNLNGAYQLPALEKTIFAVFRENTSVVNAGVISIRGTTTDWNSPDGFIFGPSNKTIYRFGAGRWAGTNNLELLWTESPTLACPLGIYTSIEANPNNASFFYNGVLKATDTLYDASSAQSLGGICVGGRYSGATIASPWLNGDICEILYFGTALSKELQQKIEGYLAHKWGLASSLPDTHKYKYAPPVSENNQYNVVLTKNDTNWKNRLKLSINGSLITSTIDDFPLRVIISVSSGINKLDISNILSTLKENKYKLSVVYPAQYGEQEKECYVEIAEWDVYNKYAVLWVRVPKLLASVNTELYIYYDNESKDNVKYVGGISSIPGQKVWDNDYVAVYHLCQDIINGIPCIKDSTKNQVHGTPATAFASTDLVRTTKYGKSLRFDAGDYIDCGTPVGIENYTLWTPADINTGVWFDAADAKTIIMSTGVSTWYDKSGNNCHVTQGAASYQPALSSYNGKNVIDFDGTDDMLFCNTMPLKGSPITVFAVAEFTNHVDVDYVYMYGSLWEDGREYNLTCDGSNNIGFYHRPNQYNSTAVSTQNFAIYEQEFLSSDPYLNLYIDGIQKTQASPPLSQKVTTANLFLGSTGDGSYPHLFGGRLGEFIIIFGAVTESIRKKIEGYLAHKWGLAANLPLDHTYKDSPPVSYSSWTPEKIQPALWLDASDSSTITITGSGVSEWRDKSGNTRHATQSTDGDRPPLSVLNGKSVVSFDGSGDKLAGSYSATFTSRSVFILFKYSGSVTNQRPFTQYLTGYDDWSTPGWCLPVARNVGNDQFASEVSGFRLASVATVQDRYMVFSHVHTGAAVTNTVNGSTTANSAHTLNLTVSNYMIGTNPVSNDAKLTGAIAEIIVLDYAANDATRKKIEGYLAHKWGVQHVLSPGHPYKYKKPTTYGRPFTNGITLECFAKATAGGTAGASIILGSTANYDNVSLYVSNYTLLFSTNGSSWTQADKPPTSNTESYSIAVIPFSGTAWVDSNGSGTVVTATSGIPKLSIDWMRLGCHYNYTGGYNFVGTMTEARISNTTRSVAYGKATYNTLIDNLVSYKDHIVGVSNEWLRDENGSKWADRIRIDIDRVATYEELTDFPVLIKLGKYSGLSKLDTSDVLAKLGNNKLKIAVVYAEQHGYKAHQCYVEIETWNVNNFANLWVKVPKLSCDVTTLYLYYDTYKDDNTSFVGLTGTTAARNVWDANYVAVYHMHNDPTYGILDSTAQVKNCTMSGSMTSYNLVEAEKSNSIDFDGSDDALIASSVTETFANGVTVDAFVTRKAQHANGSSIIGKGGTTTDQLYGDWNLVESSTDKRVYFAVNANTAYAYLDNLLINGTPVVLTGTYDKSNVKLFANGVDVASSAYTTALTTTKTNYLIGNYFDNLAFNGTMHEIRVSNKARSDSWIFATNATLRDQLCYFSRKEKIVTKQIFENAHTNGQPWRQQYDFNTVDNGDITGWATGTSLPGALSVSQSIVTKNRVYLLGGYNGSSYVSTVYTAPINDDGTLGTWTTGTSLPGVLGEGALIVTKNKVYLLGGVSSGIRVSTVYTAPINEDGTLGTWTTGTSLPGNICHGYAITTKNKVYLIGNNTGGTITTIYTAQINDDGTLGIWSTATSALPQGVELCQVIVTKNRAYVLGGYNSGALNTVYTAPINSDGTLGTWTTGTSLPGVLTSSRSVVTKNRVYLLGGYNASESTSIVYTASINDDGTLGTWTTGTSLPGGTYHSQVITTNSKIYLLGGSTTNSVNTVYQANFSGGKNSYLEDSYSVSNSTKQYSDKTTPVFVDVNPCKHQNTFNDTITTDITGWTLDTDLPDIVQMGRAIVTKNRVYLIGGYSTTQINKIYTAPINAYGVIGTWAVDSNTLPVSMYASGVAQIKNYVYLIGGHTSVATSNVYRAVVANDGTLGPFTLYGTIPEALTVHEGVIITKNRIYIMGSYLPYSTSTYTAKINDVGDIGKWEASPALPAARCFAGIIRTSSRVYICGGSPTSNAPTNTIYSSVINDAGMLEEWKVEAATLPGNIYYTTSINTKNRAWLLGGSVTSSTSFNVVYTAPINSDGTLGNWSTGTNLATINGLSAAVITSSRVYMLGGWKNTGSLATVMYAPFSGGKNNYIDLEPQVENITLNKKMYNTYPQPCINGQPWALQYSLNSEYNSANISWTTGTSLPGNLSLSSPIVTKNRVYLLGGNTTVAVNTVYTAPINDDGTLGTWSTGTSLPGTLSTSCTFITKNRVYLCGGNSAGSAVATVYTAPINDDGTLGTWTTGTSLPGILEDSTVVVTKNRVYLLGGDTPTTVSTVYTAPINDDGTLGTWTTGTSLPGALQDSAAVVTKNRVYLCGGWNGSATVSTVYTAPINDDGTLGTWTTDTSLPGNLRLTSNIVINNRVYLFGGWTTAAVSTVYTAPINSDGTLGTWTTGTSLPGAFSMSSIIATNSKLYLLGGYTTGSVSTVYYADFRGGKNSYLEDTYAPHPTAITKRYYTNGQPWKQQYNFNAVNNGDITGWTTGTSLPSPIRLGSPIVTRNRVYLCGGYNGSDSVSTVYTAPINDDGTLGTWTTGTSLPGNLRESCGIVTKNRVYLLGGFVSGSSSSSTVYTAPINDDGALGTWTTGTSLPGNLSNSSVLVTKNRVYLCGGYTSTEVATVYTAPINDDGTLGTWTTGTSLPGVLGDSTIVTTKNRVYLLGGFTTASSSIVYTAPINDDGTLGTWTTGTSLPGSFYQSSAFCNKNRVYLLAGATTVAVNTVYTAPINDDGTLGTWSIGTALPSVLRTAACFITSSRVYLCGGYTTGMSSSVYYADFFGGKNDYMSDSYVEKGFPVIDIEEI